MLVPDAQGSLGTPIYVFTIEMTGPVVSRNTSCTQLLWNPRDTSKEGALFYLVTFENWRPRGKENFMYAVTVETP
jgi:hypothetical protein